MRFHFAAILFKFQRLDAAIGRQAQIDAGMRGQILRPLRSGLFREIGRRTDDRHAYVRADFQALGR